MAGRISFFIHYDSYFVRAFADSLLVGIGGSRGDAVEERLYRPSSVDWWVHAGMDACTT